MLLRIISRYLSETKGATAIQYGLIASFTGLGITSGLDASGVSITNVFKSAGYAMAGGHLGGSGDVSKESATAITQDQWDNKDANGSGYLRTMGLEGWELSGAGRVDILENGREGIYTPGGTDIIDLVSGSGQVSGIKKDLGFLQEGETVTLSFAASSSQSGANTRLEVVHNGVVLDVVTPNSGNEFVEYSYDIVGASSNSIELREAGDPNQLGFRGTLVADIKVTD